MLTRDYQANLLKIFGGPKCRFCDAYAETIDHVVPDDAALSSTEYNRRRDMMGQYLHWKIFHFHGKELA